MADVRLIEGGTDKRLIEGGTDKRLLEDPIIAVPKRKHDAMLLKQSTARDRVVMMYDSADHVTGKTGLTLTITASKNGAAYASISPTVTERGNGSYALALTSSHTDTLGDLALKITSSGADQQDVFDQVVADLPGATVASVTGAVGSVTGAVGSVTGSVGSVTGAVGSVTGNVGGNVTGSVGSVAAGGITASSIADNAIDSGAIASDAITSAKIADGAITANKLATGAITNAKFAAGAVDAAALAADAVDEIWDEVVDGSLTGRQSMRLANAANAGKLSGAATTTVVIRDPADSKNRISATVDANGNRSAVTTDVT